MFCLLSIRKYDARMIMYARALYRSFKVKWIGKVYFPTHVLFIINTVIQGAHDDIPSCVIQYTRAGNVKQAHFEICPFRAPYCKLTLGNYKSFGAICMGYTYITKS